MLPNTLQFQGNIPARFTSCLSAESAFDRVNGKKDRKLGMAEEGQHRKAGRGLARALRG